MSYIDFIKHISIISNVEKSYADLENIINCGISWCDQGEDENDEATTLCASCKHYKECDALYDRFACK